MSASSAVAPIGLAKLKRNTDWQKLERWNWPGRISFISHGVQTAIQVTEPAALVPIKLRLPPGSCESEDRGSTPQYSLVVGNEMGPPALERLNLLFRGKALIAAAYKLEPVLGALESDLDLRVASQAGPERIFIRVGVVGWQGRAIVVGGEPRGGTSTLVAAMLRAGASYYSDQYAVLDSRGWVYPYARPLWLSSGARGNPVRYRPEELGSTAGMEAQKVGTVVFVSYRPGARQWLIRLEQSTVEADLMDYAVCARQYQREAQSAVSKALAGARIFRGVCGEADSFVDLLLR